MAGIIYGRLEYKDEEYPFVLENHILSIVQCPGQYQKDFEGVEKIDTVLGVAANNRLIEFLGLERIHGSFVQDVFQILFKIKGYVFREEEEELFNEIEFSSSALNVFYSTGAAWAVEEHEEVDNVAIEAIKIQPHRDVSKKFNITINNEAITCELGFRNMLSYKPEEKNVFTVETVFSMEFETSKKFVDIIKYYFYVRDFLAFCNFENDIPIGDIILKRKTSQQILCIGVAKIFQGSCDKYVPDSGHSITYADLSESSFCKLFTEIAEQREKNIYNPYFIPEYKIDGRSVDMSRWLITAIAFEGEFTKKYKDYKSDITPTFKKVKDELLATIERLAKESGHGINHDKNKELKSFKSLIGHCDTTIEEKYRFCEEHFAEQIKDCYECFSKDTKLKADDEIDFAHEYALSRNRTAHGSVGTVSKIDIVTYRMLRCFIYLLIMERAEVNTEKMREIILRLF